MDTPTQTKPSGFTVTRFEKRFAVTIFPNSNSFEPVKGEAIGVEECNVFHSKRLIAKHLEPVFRKAGGKEAHWPDSTLYLSARDVDGWPSPTPD